MGVFSLLAYMVHFCYFYKSSQCSHHGTYQSSTIIRDDAILKGSHDPLLSARQCENLDQ